MTPLPPTDPRLIGRLLTIYRTPGASVEDELERVVADPDLRPFYRDAVIDAAREGMQGHHGDRMCRFCDEGPFKDQSGRMCHEAYVHPEEREAAIPRAEIARAYLEDFTPIRRLATRYGISVDHLKRILAEQNVKVRGTGVPKGRAAA